MAAAPGPQLRDIHLPPPAGWWPPAPGWWVLAGILLLLVAGLAWHWHRRRPLRRRWRQACRELDALLAAHAVDHDAAAFAAGVSQLLRRAARVRDPASTGLRGQAWRAALQDLAGRGKTAPVLLTLEEAMYRPATTLDVPQVAAAARQWLRRVLRRGGRRA